MFSYSPRPISTEAQKRVVVFIDEANVYNDARRCFHTHTAPSPHGRTWPMRFGRALAERQPLGTSDDRILEEVRVYTGQPSGSKQPKSYAAHRRQAAAWRKSGVTVVARPLRYPSDWPKSPPEQKGVDVQIAIDMVAMAIRNQLDIAILASTDTDLKPALEAFYVLPFSSPKQVEVAAWRKEGFARKLGVAGNHCWCHFLDAQAYEPLRDHRDYTRS